MTKSNFLSSHHSINEPRYNYQNEYSLQNVKWFCLLNKSLIIIFHPSLFPVRANNYAFGMF